MFLAKRLFSIPVSFLFFFSFFIPVPFISLSLSLSFFFLHYNPNNVSGNTLFSLVEPFQTQNILIT